MQQISIQLSNELGANEWHTIRLLALNTPKLKETGTVVGFSLPGSKLESDFSVVIAFSHRKITLDFKMTTFPMITSNPTRPPPKYTLWTHKKGKDVMISIQCPYSLKLLPNLYKMKANR